MNARAIEFHIELTNICTLKCPGCERTRFIAQWGKHWKNSSIDIDALLSFLDCDLLNVPITLCGNLGDPIYHPDLHRVVKLLKQRGAIIRIITNGSYKTQDWWTELCSILNHDDCIIFSIDGLPSNSNQYRINSDWESIKVGIDVAVGAACQTMWKYIPFRYNQDNIEQARELSKEFGIDQFKVEFSDRFDQQTEHLRPVDNLLGIRYYSQTDWKQHKVVGVNPECKNNKMHYISANGYYMPCCYIGDHRFYYKTDLWKHKENYSIANNKFNQLISSAALTRFNQTLDQQAVCQFNCPKIHEKSQIQPPETDPS
jgi:hypothetical protein